MLITDISWWGIAVVLAMTAGTTCLMMFADRQTMQRMVRAIIFAGTNMVIITLIAWVLCHTGSWWAAALWAVLMAIATTLLALHKAHVPQQRYLLPVLPSVVLGLLVGSGSLMFCLQTQHPMPVFIAVVSVLCAGLTASTSKSLQTYTSSLRHTGEHYRYLLASGATHLEAAMPSIKRSLRAAVQPSLSSMKTLLATLPPLLFCGLLMAGATPVAAAVATTVVLLSMLTSGIVTTLLMLYLLDRVLFDKNGQPKL